MATSATTATAMPVTVNSAAGWPAAEIPPRKVSPAVIVATIRAQAAPREGAGEVQRRTGEDADREHTAP